MKTFSKVAVLLFVLIISLFVTVSCSGDVNSGSTVKVCLPNFLQSTAKGLVNMTDESQNSPFDDFGLAQGVMTTMPVMTSVRTVSLNSSNLEQQVNNALASTIYPYGMKCVLVKAISNPDGVYCSYKVMEGTKEVGFFDYYYNSQTNRFSYKEFVIVTAPQSDPLLLALEYDDVKIDNYESSTPSFSVGQLKDGLFATDGFVDSIDIHSDYVDVKRDFITAKSDSSMFASMTRPGENIHYLLENTDTEETDSKNAVRLIQTKKLEYISGLVGDAIEAEYRNNLNLSRGIEMTTGVYPNLGSMVANLETGYSSYSAYCALSFKNSVISSMDNENVTTTAGLARDNMSVLSFETGKGASVQNAYKNFHEVLEGPSHDPFTCIYCKDHPRAGVPALFNTTNNASLVSAIDNYVVPAPYSYMLGSFLSPYTMFERVYHVDPDKELTEVNYQIALATRHMKACGLSDTDAENYARNLVYSERQIGSTLDPKQYIYIDARSNDTFITDFGAANTTT